MRKLMYGGLFLASVGIAVLACKKESTQATKNENIVFDNSLNIASDGRMLIFKTVADYEKIMNNPSDALRKEFLEKVSKMKHTTYAEKLALQKSGEDLIGDAYLNQILNEDWIVQIGDYLYRVNKPSEKVFVLPVSHSDEYQDLLNENKSNKYLLQFSTEDNVLELLEGGEVISDKAMSKNCQSSIDNDTHWEQYATLTDVNNIYGNGTDKKYKFERKLMVRYDNWGISRKLFTEFKHNENWWGLYDETHFTIVYQVDYVVKNGSSGSSSHYPSYDFALNPNYTGTGWYEYNDDNKEVVHYQGTKCLRAFDLKGWCWMRDRADLKPKLVPNSGYLQIRQGF